MKKIFLALLILMYSAINAQNPISHNEVKYIQDEATNLVELLEQLLNLIGDVYTSPEERREYIEDSYKKVVYDESVYFEDDLIQDRSQIRNVPVKEYLNNTYFFYKDSGVNFDFQGIRVSDVYTKDYLFVLVYFNRYLNGTSISENKVINNTVQRVAEIRLTRAERQWDMHIVNVRFPNQADNQADYQKVSTYQSAETFIAPKDSRISDLETALNKQSSEIQKRKKESEDWLRSKNDDYSNKLDVKDNKIATLENKVASLEQEYKDMLTEKDQQIEKLKGSFTDIAADYGQLKEEKGKFAQLKKDNADLQKKVESFRSKVNALENALDEPVCYVTDGNTTTFFSFSNNIVKLPYKRSKIDKLLSPHNQSSYIIEKLDKQNSKFTILDPLIFWKDSDKKVVILMVNDDPEKAVIDN